MSRSTQRSSVNTEVSLLLRCLVLSRSSSQTQREVQSARCRDHYLTVSSYFHQQAGLEVSTVVPLVVHVFKLLSGSHSRCTRLLCDIPFQSWTTWQQQSVAWSCRTSLRHRTPSPQRQAGGKHTFSVRTQRQCPKPFGFQCSSLRPRHIQVSGVVESTMPPPVK